MTEREALSSTVGEVQAHNLTLIWGCSVIAGAIAISWLWGVNAWRLAIPLLIMAVYFFYGVRLPNKNTQQFADSMYFMGFLWTLWALFTGTVIRRALDSELSPTALGIVFGYALITTAVGMFCRVALLQSQHLLTDQMLEGREDFERRLHGLMTALDQATGRVQESGTVLSGAVTRTATDMTAATETAIRTLSDGTEGATRVFAERVRAALEVFEGAVGSLAPAVEPIASGFKDIATQMGTSSRALKRSLGQLASSLESGATRLDEITPKLTQSVETAGEAVKQFVITLESSPAQLEELQSAARKCGEGFLELKGQLDRLADYATTSVGTAVAEDLRKLAEVEAAIGEARVAASLLQSCVIEVVELVRRELKAPQ